jgi:hypothetical protein
MNVFEQMRRAIAAKIFFIGIESSAGLIDGRTNGLDLSAWGQSDRTAPHGLAPL